MPSAFPPSPKTYVATSDPGVSSDSSQGYAVGSSGLNSSTRSRWICVDATAGAAKWLLMDYADHPGYVAGQWYLGRQLPILAGAAMTLGNMRFTPWVLKGRVTLNALGCRISTAGAAGAKIDIALYASTAPGAMQKPTGNKLVNTGDIVATGTGSVNGAVSVQLEPGFYWLATNCNDSTIVCNSHGQDVPDLAYLAGSATQGNVVANNSMMAFLLSASTYGTWPDMTSVTPTETTSSAYAAVQFKAASVP